MKSTFNVHHNNNQYHNFAMTKCYSSFKFSHNYQSDNNPHGPVEDRQTPEVGEGGSKVGPLLRVWGSPAHVVDVLLCAHRPLAGLHMVRHRQLRTLPTAGWLLDANFLSFFFIFLFLMRKYWIIKNGFAIDWWRVCSRSVIGQLRIRVLIRLISSFTWNSHQFNSHYLRKMFHSLSHP